MRALAAAASPLTPGGLLWPRLESDDDQSADMPKVLQAGNENNPVYFRVRGKTHKL